MDILTFVVELAKALGWPIAVVTMLLVLRRPLRGLIPLLTKLKYKDLELEFGERIEEAKQEAAALPKSPDQKEGAIATTESIARLAELSPRAAVLESWRTVEEELTDIGHRLSGPEEIVSGLGPMRRIRPNEVLRSLEREKRADPNMISLLRHLQHLRNEAAHAPQFALSEEAALDYGALAERVRQELGRLGV